MKKIIFVLPLLAAVIYFNSCTDKSPVDNTPLVTPDATTVLSQTVTETVTVTATFTMTATPTFIPTLSITPGNICKVFGNSDYSGTLHTSNRTTFSKFTLDSQQTVTRIYFYAGVDSVMRRYKVGIYSDNAGFPGVLLTSPAAEMYVWGLSWHSLDIDDLNLAAADYWLAIASPDISGDSPSYGNLYSADGGIGGIYTISGVILPADCSAYSSFDESYTSWAASVFAACD